MCARPYARNATALLELHGDLRHVHSERRSAQRAEAGFLATAQSASGLHEYFSSSPRHSIPDHRWLPHQGPSAMPPRSWTLSST
jgi:hypothetical protein